MYSSRSKGLTEQHSNPRVNEFLLRPSFPTLRSLVREELVLLARHWGEPRELCTARFSIFELRQHLSELAVERGVLTVEKMATEMTEADLKLKLPEFELKKMQLETEKEIALARQETERQIELAKISAGQETERQLGLAKINAGETERQTEQQIELAKINAGLKERDLALAEEKLRLISEGKLDASILSETEGSRSSQRSSAVHHLKLVPKFNERDLDTFFTLFERLAANLEWSGADKILLLQSVVVGKAQEVLSALDNDTIT